MANTSERELRDVLEAAQAEVKRLKAELSARDKSERDAAREALAREVEELRAQVAELRRENASLRTAYGQAEQEQRAAFDAELRRAEQEATQARDEVAQLKRQQEYLTKALAKAEARAQRQGGRPAGGSFWERLRGLFTSDNDDPARAELERAQQEIARLHQQLSLVKLRRRGR